MAGQKVPLTVETLENIAPETFNNLPQITQLASRLLAFSLILSPFKPHSTSEAKLMEKYPPNCIQENSQTQ